MGNVTAKTSGDIASFMTPAETNIKSLKVHFSPKQLGEGDPSPENVREIIGWGGVEVNGYGKNLFNYSNDEIKYNYYRNDNGDEIYSTSSFYTITSYSIQPNCKILLHNENNNFTVRIYFLTQDEQWISRTNWLSSTSKIITLYPDVIPSNCKKIQLHFTTSKPPVLDSFMLLVVNNTISYQWKRLPDEYQEVEWIKSDGNQFIQLPFGFDDTDEIETVFSIEQPQTDKYINAPSAWNSYKNRFGMGKHVVQNTFNGTYTAAYGSTTTGNTYLNPPTAPDYNLHKWTYKNHVFAIPELELSRDVSSIEWGETTANLKLFYGYNANTIGKISYYKHIKSDVSYHLIACYRKSDGEIGLYDIVNNVFYTNQGTGTFSKGEDVFCDTAYGGYIDLINGELVEEWGMFTVNEPDTTWKVNHPARIIVNFPRKYIFSSRTMPRKSMCTIIPERSSADFNYGYLDNVSSIEHDHVLFLNYTGNGEGWSELFGEEVTNENVKSHLQELGFAICATLATPITHQLTPTQLSSFIGQNNFWSNADYVEIEYDLIETIDIQKARKKIILNQPHIETLTGGNRILFNSDMKSNLKQCKVSFLPQQEGSGSPSPTNIRTISGWTGVDVYYNDMKYDIDWTNDVGTVYGGYVDFVSGEIVQEDYLFEITPETTISSSGTSAGGTYRIVYDLPYVGTNKSAIACDCYGLRDRNSEMWNYTTKKYLQLYPFNRNVNQVVLGAPQEVTTQQEWLDYLTELGQIRIVYELAEPISYPLTPQQMIILKNTNTFYTNPKNNIEIKSWALKSLIPTTDYLSNVTWTEHAYIGGNGKMASQDTSASHYTTDPISLEAGTYNLKGFSYYNGTDKTRFRIHRYYNSRDVWVEQITFDTIGNLSPVDMTFTLADAGRIRLSIAMDFNGTLTKVS